MLLFVERAGAEVVECACVIEIPDLKVCTSYTPGHLCFSKYKIEMWAAFLRSITLSILLFRLTKKKNLHYLSSTLKKLLACQCICFLYLQVSCISQNSWDFYAASQNALWVPNNYGG